MSITFSSFQVRENCYFSCRETVAWHIFDPTEEDICDYGALLDNLKYLGLYKVGEELNILKNNLKYISKLIDVIIGTSYGPTRFYTNDGGEIRRFIYSESMEKYKLSIPHSSFIMGIMRATIFDFSKKDITQNKYNNREEALDVLHKIFDSQTIFENHISEIIELFNDICMGKYEDEIERMREGEDGIDTFLNYLKEVLE